MQLMCTPYLLPAPSLRCPPLVLSDPARLQNGYTPLLWTAYHGHTAAASLLLDRGADVGAKDNVSGAVQGIVHVFFLNVPLFSLHLRLDAGVREG